MGRIKAFNEQTETIKPVVEQTGEIRLLQAIIIQALHDVAREHEGEKNAKIAYQARKWLLSNSRREFSFCWCVENSFFNHDTAAIISNVQSIVRRGDYVNVWRRLFRRSSFSDTRTK